MPHASPWPFYFAVALTVLFFMILAELWYVAVLAGVASVMTMVGWYWPRHETQET